MGVFRSPGVIFLLILSCCNFAGIASSAQSPHAQRPSVVFAFGDSLTDVGNGVRIFSPNLVPAAFQPYGITYFGNGAGRFSDGRSMIDCLVQSLGLPFLNPYFDFVGTDFSNGACYAIGGCTALDYATMLDFGYASATIYTLKDQLKWHLSFLKYAEAGTHDVTRFPTMSAIREGLYFLLVGGNDLGKLFVNGLSTEILRNASDLIVAEVTQAIQLLYEHGARNFLLTSQFPMGCSPFAKSFFSTSDFDDRGCVYALNDLILNMSTSIAAMSESLSGTLPNASFTLLDTYSAFEEMFTNPDRYGIVDTVNACCAANNVPDAALVNGFSSSLPCGPVSRVCGDPNTYLNWEGYHYTDNTVRQIVNMFAEGKFIMPSDGLAKFGAAQISKALRQGHVGHAHSSVIQ